MSLFGRRIALCLLIVMFVLTALTMSDHIYFGIAPPPLPPQDQF